MDEQSTLKKGMLKLHERAAKDLLRHDAPNWMDLVHQLDARTRETVLGLCWLHGLSAGQIDRFPLPLSRALTTKCTSSQAREKRSCPLW